MSSSFRGVLGDQFEGVIVPAATAAEYWRFSTGRDPEALWEADEEKIHELEARLDDYLQAHADPRAVALAAKLDSYKRQYLTVVDGGHHQIELRALCNQHIDEHQVDWQNQVVQVLGGGDCFFEVLYNADEQTFVHVIVHGES